MREQLIAFALLGVVSVATGIVDGSPSGIGRTLRFYSRNLNLRITAQIRTPEEGADEIANQMPWWNVAAEEVCSLRLELPKSARRIALGDLFGKVTLYCNAMEFYEDGTVQYRTGAGDGINGTMHRNRARSRINKIWNHIVLREFVKRDGESLEGSEEKSTAETFIQRANNTATTVWGIVRSERLPQVPGLAVQNQFQHTCLDEMENAAQAQDAEDEDEEDEEIDESLSCNDRLAFSLLFDAVEVMIVLAAKSSRTGSCDTLWEFLKEVDAADTQIRYMGVVSSTGSAHIEPDKARTLVWRDVVTGGHRAIRITNLTSAEGDMCGCAIRFAMEYQQVSEIAEPINPTDYKNLTINLGLESRLTKALHKGHEGRLLTATHEASIDKV